MGVECAREPSPSPGNWEAGIRAEWQFPRGCDGVTGGTGGRGEERLGSCLPDWSRQESWDWGALPRVLCTRRCVQALTVPTLSVPVAVSCLAWALVRHSRG